MAQIFFSRRAFGRVAAATAALASIRAPAAERATAGPSRVILPTVPARTEA